MHLAQDLNQIPPNLPFNPILPRHDEPKKQILGFEIKDLAQLAPIAIAMYCFNEFPQFTMISLSIMILIVIGARERINKKCCAILGRIKKLYHTVTRYYYLKIIKNE